MKKTISIILIAVLASRAEANPAQAQVLFKDAMTLLEQGKIAEACDAFAASQRSAPTLTTLLNLATCRERNHQIATAWGLYVEVVRQTRGGVDATARAANELATEKSAQLEPRVSKLTISVPADSRVALLAIAQNGVPIDEGTWNRSLPVDGGTYTITARAPGSAEWSTKIEVAPERDTRTVEVPKLQTVPPPAAPVPAETAPVARPARGNGRVLALGGGAVVAAGLAIGFELSGRSTYALAERELNGDERRALWQSANTQRYVAQAFAVAGVACAGVAAWMYVRGRREEPGRVAVGPVIDRDRAGIGVMGRF